MGIVLRPRHILQLSYGDDATLYAVGSALDHLCTIILETHLVFVEFNTVRYDGLYGWAGEQLRVKTCFLDGLLLPQGTLISQIHSFSKRPLQILVIWREIKEILMEQLDVCLGLDVKGHLVLTALCHKRYASVQHIHLLLLVSDQLGGKVKTQAANHGAGTDGQQYREHGELCLLL